MDESEFDSSLLFGANEVYLRTVKGNVKCLRKDVWLQSSVKTCESKVDESGDIPSVLKDAALRRLPQMNLGMEYSCLMLPSMPCLDVSAMDEKPLEEDSSMVMSDSISSFDSTLLRTWMKCERHECSELDRSSYVRCFQSGVRSALVSVAVDDGKKKQQWLRLKGCGNLSDGVMFACISQKEGCSGGVSKMPLIEMRGVCFEHTVQRELYMNDRITQLFDESPLSSHIICANESIGYIEYKDTMLNKVRPSCGIFRTLGNRRLGSHLLYSLDCLIPCLFDINDMDDEKTCVDLYHCFPELRLEMSVISDEGTPSKKPISVSPTHLAVACEMPVISLDTLKTMILPGLSNDPNRMIEIDFDGNDTHRNEYERAYQRLIDAVKRSDDGSESEMMIAGFRDWRVYLCYRIGWESGFIQRVLKHNELVWGTFTDALGYHCNAHCNNVVIRDDETSLSSEFILAPLDFDLAFEKDEYFGEFREQVKSVLKDALHRAAEESGAEWPRMFADMCDSCASEEFASLIQLEESGHRLSLSGDPYISTGVSGLNVEQKHPNHTLMSVILRDALVSGYNDSLLNIKDSDIVEAWDKLTGKISDMKLEVIRQFIRLCLVVSRRVTA